MKVGLFGFGKTGKQVAATILGDPGFSLEWVMRTNPNFEHHSVSEFLGVDSEEPGLLFSISKTKIEDVLKNHPVDVIIDFSSPTGLDVYGEAAAHRKIIIISAISHYKKNKIDYLKKLAERTTVLWSPNITFGVNYLMFAAKYLKKIAPWADVQIVEEHFKEKEGISGTALKIADALEFEPNRINVIRAGGIIGKHELIFGFPYQTVRLTHESISRKAFGNGALFAAKALQNKKTGFYKFEDILMHHFEN